MNPTFIVYCWDNEAEEDGGPLWDIYGEMNDDSWYEGGCSNSVWLIPGCYPVLCEWCGEEIDEDTCMCGDPIDSRWHEGHLPVPMGCKCGYSKPR